MLTKRVTYTILSISIVTQVCQAKDLFDGMTYKVEMQASLSKGSTPLWLNANKFGLSSIESSNGYLRAAVERPLSQDSTRKWGIGYGVDMAAAYHYTSDIVVQQAYVEGRWLHGTLTIGSKEYPMELKNNSLSSGSQTLGINARPVPQVRIALPEYWVIPFTKGWVSLKGHIAFGKMTDDNWQHKVTNRQIKYADDVLYHSKAGYLKIGNDYRFYPFSVEMGLEMGSLFGGTMYRTNGKGGMDIYHGGTGLKDFFNEFIPGGAEADETTYQNIAGDMLGSWVIRFNYDADSWKLGVYADHFFEDQSAMFLLDYDGYGEGDEWNQKKKSKYLLYDLKDIMLGAELKLKRGRWIRDIVFEYIYTKYQSGPVYHDRTPSISDHIGGIDDYYNHGLYSGWQHWGQVIGNPLYRSPIYNDDGTINIENNRFYAFHLGLDGTPVEGLDYRILATWQKGFGTYRMPFLKPQENAMVLAEIGYKFASKSLNGVYVKCGLGADFGRTYGNNRGCQITIGKKGWL